MENNLNVFEKKLAQASFKQMLSTEMCLEIVY